MPFVTTTPQSHAFGSLYNIPVTSGAYFELNNPGFATLGFHADPDGDGIIRYQGSFDGINYTEMTMRQMDGDGYTFECSGAEDYIGSIASLRSIRFVNKTGSSSPCTVMGVMSVEASTLEGIENGAAPHRFGHQLISVGFDVTAGIVANSGLFFPAPRHKFIVTDVSFGIASAAATTITFHEGSGNANIPNKWVFSTYANLANNAAEQINAGFNTPYVASQAEAGLYLTTSTAVTMRGIIHGYNAEE